MARRIHLIDEPVSRLAAWSRRLALFALAVAALSIVIVRSGLLEIVPALTTFAAALIFAVLAVLLSLPAYVVIWRHGRTGLGSAISGMVLGLLLLVYPAYLGYKATKLPPISDITTDPATRRASTCWRGNGRGPRRLSRRGDGADAAEGLSRRRAAAGERAGQAHL